MTTLQIERKRLRLNPKTVKAALKEMMRLGKSLAMYEEATIPHPDIGCTIGQGSDDEKGHCPFTRVIRKLRKDTGRYFNYYHKRGIEPPTVVIIRVTKEEQRTREISPKTEQISDAPIAKVSEPVLGATGKPVAISKSKSCRGCRRSWPVARQVKSVELSEGIKAAMLYDIAGEISVINWDKLDHDQRDQAIDFQRAGEIFVIPHSTKCEIMNPDHVHSNCQVRGHLSGIEQETKDSDHPIRFVTQHIENGLVLIVKVQ